MEVKIKTTSLNHPDGAVTIELSMKIKRFVIFDHEHIINTKSKFNRIFKNADALIYDSTYDDDSFSKYVGWVIHLARAQGYQKNVI